MKRLRIFLSIVFRIDDQYGFIGPRLAWWVSKALADYDDWKRIT